jgi:hypothetical protein
MVARAGSPTPQDLTPEIAQARTYAEADLLSGVVALRRYVERGAPQALNLTPHDDPASVLASVLSAVEPEDLSPGARQAWMLLRKGKTPTLPDWATTYGMGVAYQAPVAARTILRMAEARRALREAREAAMAALESLTDAAR